MTEDAKWLYDKLSSRGYNLGSESEFEQTLTSDDNIEWYYRKGTNVGLKLGTYDEFKTSLFPASTTEPIVTSETSDTNKDERNHYQTLLGSDTSFAEKYIKEQEEKKKAQAKVQENYLNSGLSEQDKAQREEYNKLMGEQAMNQMVKTFGLEQPVLNEYGMPTSAKTEPMYNEQKTTIPLKTQEQQVEEQIQNMPEYITRGEDDLYKIKANSIERALNTREGKELFTQLFNEASFLFKNSGEGIALLDKYNKGEISEDEVEKAFQDKHLQDIYNEFFNAVTREGGVMHDYFSVAYSKLGKDSAKKGANAIDRAIEEYEKAKELALNDEIRERYKAKYGVYPEDDSAVRIDVQGDGYATRWRRLIEIEGEIKKEEQVGYKTGGTKQYRKDLPKIIQLNGAKEFNEEAKNLIDAVEVQKQKKGGGFFTAFGRTVSDVDTWDMGFSNLMRSGALLEVLKKVDANSKLPEGERVSTDKLLTKEEKLLMDSALNYFAVSAFYSDSLGRGYKAGTTSAASIPFMLQFVLSAGSLSALEASVNAAAKEGGEWLIGTLAKYGTEKMAKVAASEGFKAVGKASAGIVSSIIGAGALTAAWDIPSIAAGSFERQIGQMKPVFGEDGNSFVYGGRINAQGAGEATWNAFADKYTERLSEMVLAKAFDPIKAWGMTTNTFKSIAKSDLVSTMIEIGRHPVTKAIKEKAMFGGLLEEMLEEELGGLLRLATNTDVNSLKEAGLDMDGQIDIFLGLAPTSLLFSGVGAASYYGKLAINSKKLRDSLVSESERNMFDKLMSESRSGKFGDLAHELIRDVILTDKTKTGRKITNEQKRDLLIGILNKYQDVLSNELQEQTKTVIKEENDAAIDNIVKNGSYGKTGNIYVTTAENGKRYVIVGGNVEFDEIDVAGEKQRSVDISNSDAKVQVREVLGGGKLGNVEKIRTASLTGEVNATSAEEYKKFNQAMNKAEQEKKETFEYGDNVYETATSKKLGTKEEYGKRKKQEEELAKKENKPTINTEPRLLKNESFNLVVDGKNKKVTFYNTDFVQNEDGSINTDESGMFIVEVGGEKISRSQQEDYINALSEHLKSEHAKAIEEYDRKQLEQGQANNTPEQPKIISEEDRAARAAEQERQAKEAEKQTILEGRKRDKTGDIDMDKLTPEETVLTYMEEETPESLMQLLTEQLQYLHSQVASIQEKDLSPVEKKNKTRKIQQSINAYEAAIEKWLGADALAVINTPAVEEEIAETPAPAAETEEVVEAPAAEEVVAEQELEEPVEEPIEETIEEDVVEAEDEEITEEIEAEEPIIDINNIAVYRRNISGNNSDMYRFVQKGEEGQEDGVEDLFQVTDGGRKKKRTDKFSRMDNAKTGYIDNNKDKPCIILDINQQEGYANVLTNYGVQQMPLERVYQSEKEGVTLRGSNPRLENDAKYTTFESLMSMPLVHVGDRNGLTITVKDVIDGARSKKPYSTIEEQVKIAVEKFAPKNADIDALVSDSMSEFRKSFNEAARLWNNITTASNLGNSRIKSAMTKDSKHNPILEIRKSFAELSKINNERIEAGEDSIFSVELIDSFTAVDTSTAFISKEITELSVPEMIEYAKDIFHALQNADIVPSEFKTLLNEVLSYLCRKPTKNGNVDHMRHKRNAFMKELGIKAEAEGGVYKDILKEALRKKALKEASKYLVSENLVTELSEEDSASQENAKQPQEKEEKKEKPAKKPASKVTTALMDSVVSLSVRVNNESLPKLQRDLAKAALADKLDKLSPEETLELYNMMIAERNVSQGVMVEDITKAMELVESSKKGAIITQERERIMAAIEAAQAVEEEKVEETETPDIDFEALIAERNELEDNLPDMSDDEIVAANTRIAEINEILSNQAELMVDEKVQESRKAAKVIINLLKKAGVRVVEVTEQQIEQMIGSDEYKKLTADGIVYGAAHKGIIYLNSEHLNPNTPLHEFTHLWVDWYKNEFKEEWERFVKLAVKSKVAKQLKTKEAYKKLNDSDLASEVLSRYTGYTYGAMTEEEKSEFENLMNTTGSIEEQIAEKPLLKAIREFWKRIISIFDKTVLEVKEEEAIDDMIRRFSKLPMLTLIRGKEAVDEMKEMAKKGTMVVYHGTAAEFSQFDHDFMGTGEGAQAYGCGTYVSQVKDIAVSYAKADANRKKYSKEPENPFDKISEPDLYVLFNNYIRAFEAGIDMDSFIKDMRWTIVQHIEGLIRKYDKYLVLSTPSFGMSVASIRNAVFVLRETGESYANSAMGHTLLKYADAIESMTDDIEAYENMQKHKEDKDRFFNALNKSIVNAERHLYTVEIPAESYTENGKIDIENSPYLGWDDWYPNDSNVARAIVRALSKMSNELMTELENTPDPTYGHIGISLAERFITNKDIVGLYEDRYITNDIREKVIKYIELNSIIDRNLNYGGFYGKELYSELHDIFGRDELKSKWLLSQGIVGIRVSTNATSGNVRDTKNYVIFNEADAQIVDHIKFMTGKSAENLDNSKKSSNFAANNENYERTKEFRELQERSLGLSQSRISEYQSGRTKLSDEDRRRVGGIFQRLMESERNGGRNAEWTNLTGKGSTFKVAQVNPAIFHDVFQICRNYLPNGELVDLHDSYADCKCFISEDGLCGFAIEPNGNLISVFSLNPSDKRGFLYAIKDLIRQEGATHLDCYVSNKQPLAEIYEKALGFYVASEMDYNMEYDHDNIAENHGMPKVAFMVDRRTEKRSFDGESYDAAYEYQQSQTSIAEREQIVSGAKANGTYMLAPNGQPTNLTEDQWVTVRTQAFKDYFGDWQNDPANASVVVDENGEPMVVYHGSRMAGFDKFGRDVARDSQGIYTTPNRRAAESYATSVEEWRSEQTMPEAEIGVSDQHGVYSLFVNMRNPKVIDFGGKRFDEYGETKYEVATNEALDYGERGIIFDTLEEAEAYIAEHPEEDLDYVEKRTTSDDMLVQAKEEGYDGVIFTNIIDSRYPDPITNYVPFESNQVKSATQNIGTFNAEDDRIQFMIGPAASTSAPVDPTLLLDEKAAKALEVKSKKYAAKLANPKVDLPEEIGGMFVAKNFDRTEGIRRIMESIAEFRKSHGLPKMGEGFDVRTLVETKDSKINNQIKSFDNNQVKRLERIVNKWAKRIENSDIYKKYKNEQLRNQEGEVTTLTPIEFLERYLIACDSIERQVLTKNPRGIGGFLQRMGITVKDFHDEFVKELVNDKRGKDMREELWEAVRGVTRVTLEVGRESGLISQDEYDKDIKRQFYVPERDFAEVEANKELWIEGAEWSKRKRGKKLRAMQKAKKEGGLTLAANVLSNMLDLTYDAIAKAEENKVKVAMFDLLSANEAWCNQNKVPAPIRVWYEIGADGKPVRRTTEPSRAEREEMKKYKGKVRNLESLILNEEDRKAIYEGRIDELNEKLNSGVSGTEKADIENDIAELKTLVLQSNDKIQEWKDDIEVYKAMYPYMDTIDVRNIMFESREQQKRETVIAYIDGVPCEMHFPNMEIVADCLNNVRYDDWYFDDIKKVTSYASAIFTVYNPTFFTVNLARDIPWILSKGYAEYGWQFPIRFTAKLIAETFSSTIWKAVAGKDYSDSLYSEHFNEFFEGGGNTGYTQLPEMQRIKKQVKDWEKKRMITWGDVGNVMSFMNEWSEVLTRSAAYSVVRDMGYNQEEGIRAAKNLSVNFNRKGLGSKFMNLFSSFSMFANAVVQGACGFYRTFKGHEDTKVERIMHVTRAIMSIGLAPAFGGFITTLLQPDDGDEYMVSDWERDNYMIFGDVRIPLSEQLKPFWCIGVNIALGMHGKRDGKAIARSLINSFFVNLVPAPNSFNSTLQMLTDAIFGYRDFSGAALADNLFTPQVLKSTNSIANNTNFMGGKFRYDIKDIPEFTMGENEPYIYRAIAELAYNLRGGDSAIKSTSIRVVNEYGEVDYVPMSKAWNVNPKQIEAWANVFIPSGIRDFANAAAVAVGKLKGDEDAKFNSKEYNFITRFYKPQDKELNQYFLLKDIKKEVDYYNTAKSTAMKNTLGSDIVGNQEWEERATQMYEELSENTLMTIEASLIKLYDELHMDKISKKYALTREQMEQGIGKEEIEEIDRERDNILRKILILDMERKGNELYTYDDFVKQKRYSEQEKEDILEEIYSELRARRPIE